MVNVAGAQFQIGALKSDAGRWTIGEVEGWNFGAIVKIYLATEYSKTSEFLGY